MASSSRPAAQIELQSDLGRGTTFRLRFPQVADSGLPRRHAKRAPLARSGSCSSMTTSTSARPRLARSRSAAMTVVEACDGADALRQLRERDGIDLLITDIVMPVMTGRELVEAAAQGVPAAARALHEWLYRRRDHAARHHAGRRPVPREAVWDRGCSPRRSSRCSRRDRAIVRACDTQSSSPAAAARGCGRRAGARGPSSCSRSAPNGEPLVAAAAPRRRADRGRRAS